MPPPSLASIHGQGPGPVGLQPPPLSWDLWPLSFPRLEEGVAGGVLKYPRILGHRSKKKRRFILAFKPQITQMGARDGTRIVQHWIVKNQWWSVLSVSSVVHSMEKLMPSTIGISANKLQKSTEFYFSFISGVPTVMQGGHRNWTLTMSEVVGWNVCYFAAWMFSWKNIIGNNL